MKLIFAGETSSLALDYSRFLFNCLRNKNCQKKYFVPIRSLSDIQFFVDLPGKPTLIAAFLVDKCNVVCTEDGGGDFNDDFNDDFDIGEGEFCEYQQYIVNFDKYVVGQQPNNSWYGVFGDLSGFVSQGEELFPISDLNLDCFFFKLVFTVNGVEYIYYSEEFCIEKCEPLTHLRGCYPNEVAPADALDCNGVYYGYPANDNYLGESNFRYFHWAFVRKGSVIGQRRKLSFTYFNSKKNYKTTVNKEQLLEFELVPEFYMNYLLGIFARGNIQINLVEYRLAEEQNWQVLDLDSKLWQLDTVLAEECKNSFNCVPADCLPKPASCSDNPSSFNLTPGEEVFIFDLIGGTIELGDTIEWEILIRPTLAVIASGETDSSLQFEVPNGSLEIESKCYLLRWKKNCVYGTSTEWAEQEFGNCEERLTIPGNFDGILTGGSSVGGPAKLTINFTNPTPGDITLEAGFDFKATGGGYNDYSGGYPAPRTYALYSTYGFSNGPVTIPAGSSTFDIVGVPTIPGAPYGHIEKVILYNVTLPSGYVLDLSPVRPNLTIEIR